VKASDVLRYLKSKKEESDSREQVMRCSSTWRARSPGRKKAIIESDQCDAVVAGEEASDLGESNDLMQRLLCSSW